MFLTFNFEFLFALTIAQITKAIPKVAKIAKTIHKAVSGSVDSTRLLTSGN